jgi:signal transduction histidine kinase
MGAQLCFDPVRPASQRALVWVVSIAAVLVPAAGLAYLGAVSYRDDRGAVAERLDEQHRRTQAIAQRIERSLRAAVDAVAARALADAEAEVGPALAGDGLAAEPFLLERGGELRWPPQQALGDQRADLLARAEACPGGRGLEGCLRELQTQERRARGLDEARRAELVACPDGVCLPGEPLAQARRLYAQLARHHDTGPAALLGLARLARAAGDASGARGHLEALVRRFPDRTERGLPLGLVARLALAELDADPEPLLALQAALIDGGVPAPGEVIGAVLARITVALDARRLTPVQVARRAALEARVSEARVLEARHAALVPDAAELAREAVDELRARPARREPARTLAFRRLDEGRVVGVTVDAERLAAAAGPDAAAGIAEGAHVMVVPVGTSPPPALRTLASVPLGAAVPHLVLAIVHDRRYADPLDDVIRSRSRRHFLLTTGLAALLAIGLLATVRAASRERELARLQSHFVSTVSHELKTPLTSIRMFAEMLREGVAAGDAERQGRYHDIIVKESQRLGLLIANLLDYAQIERGTRRYSQSRERIAGVTSDAVDTFRRLQDPEAGNEVRVRVAPEAVTADAVVDREVLIGAVLNLLSNAAKYGGPGAPIDVAVGLAAGGAEVAITVTDRGPGIPPGEQARIFREFYRAPGAYSSGAPGTGLGLALVKRHVEAQGGTVSVTSEMGRGAAFTIALPAPGVEAAP